MLARNSLVNVANSDQNTGPTDGYQPNWFTPDIVTKKEDPFLYISGDVGQPSGKYNWNSDQFELMGRQRRTCDGCTEGGRHVIVSNRTLFVDDQEFFIKAVSYIPVPLGIRDMDPITGHGGGGLCSPNRTPFAEEDYRSACYDGDYYDGGLAHPERTPPGPRGGWFTALWERDFPVIKELGGNAIRVYSINPTTRLYTEQVLKGELPIITGNIVPPPLGKDHRPFMEAAHKAGLKVIYPLLGDPNMLRDMPEVQYTQFLRNQIDEVGNHPALLMYILGNELPSLLDSPSLLKKVNFYISWARNYSMEKWGRKIPISHAVGDTPSDFPYLFNNLDVDVFTANVGFRGTNFKDLWIGSKTNSSKQGEEKAPKGYAGLKELSQKYGKPHFVGEMGWKSGEKNKPDGWFNQQWKHLIREGAEAGCIGGAFYEYLDQPYHADPAKRKMGIMTSRVSTSRDISAATSNSCWSKFFSLVLFLVLKFLAPL